MMAQYIDSDIAIIGATGNVGRICVQLLLQRNLVAPTQIKLYASNISAGKQLAIHDHEFTVSDAATINFKKIHLCLLATSSDISTSFVPLALAAGAYVIDSSSLYRLDPKVPLIVTPVNKELIDIEKFHLYAIANCVASPISIVLAPLHKMFKIKRVNITTFQSTSGAGKVFMEELEDETREQLAGRTYQRKYFNKPIAFNVIPQIDKILADGYSYEEFKIIHEINKIIADDFAVTATAVRVPVMIGHSISLSIEFANDLDIDAVRELLSKSPSIKLSNDNYSTPIEVVGSDDVYVGRIRKDASVQHGLHLWLCSDNLRRGAASDVVDVAAEVIRQLQLVRK